jgi:transcriptional regulator with XRE-family HTH domain
VVASGARKKAAETSSGAGNGERVLSATMQNGNLAPVGARIRRLRIASGQSLRFVAKSLGIAPSALSMLENQQTGVSIQRLQLIARHFGLSISVLLGESEVPGGASGPNLQVIRRAQSTVPGVKRMKGILYQLPAAGPKRILQPALITFDPGAGYFGDEISHPGEEVGYVLMGELELHIGDEIKQLSQGDLVVFRTEAPHAYRNASKIAPALLFAVATPPW